MYKILSTLFWFIRQFAIPNPFEVLGDGITVMLDETPLLLTPECLNWIAGLGLPAFTFAVVGLYYSRGEGASWGSFLYMVFFCVHTGILLLMSLAYPAIWLIVLIGVIYIGLHIAVITLINRSTFI